MKKVIFIVTLIMMMAFSGLCFAADGNDLNKEQKVAETFMEVFTKDQIPAYDVVSKDFSDTLKTNVNEKAYKGFEEALQKEYPPICGMDENTISYLMSVLAYKSGDNDKAMQYGYSVISSRGASRKLKDKEREIIDILKAEK